MSGVNLGRSQTHGDWWRPDLFAPSPPMRSEDVRARVALPPFPSACPRPVRLGPPVQVDRPTRSSKPTPRCDRWDLVGETQERRDPTTCKRSDGDGGAIQCQGKGVDETIVHDEVEEGAKIHLHESPRWKEGSLKENDPMGRIV